MAKSKSKRLPTFLHTLEKEYGVDLARFEQLCAEIAKQLDQLVRDERIDLASPIEFRVKTWPSIVDKIKRSEIQPKGLAEIRDVAGIRIIALFRRDMDPIQKMIEDNFTVSLKEDTLTRLGDNQFGYGSIHYEIQPPAEWLKIPTLKKLDGLRAEVQVRTVSQHIWAAASHVLQYKKEMHVPPPLRRTINRVAALLETVDLEFERVLIERGQYAEQIRTEEKNLPLNTESLKRLLDANLPEKNRDDEGEDYAELLDDLLHFGIDTTDKLKEVIKKQLKSIMKADQALVQVSIAELEEGEFPTDADEQRTLAGVYFTHVGLVRKALHNEFPGPFGKYQAQKIQLMNRGDTPLPFPR